MTPNAIKVTAAPPTEMGRLFPFYDEDAGILTVSSSEEPNWPLGIQIRGVVVFDLSAERRLLNVDVHVRRRLWREQPLRWKWDTKAPKHDLIVSAESLGCRDFDLPVIVRKCHCFVEIAFTEDDAMDRFVQLSPRCLAAIRNGALVGIYAEIDK